MQRKRLASFFSPRSIAVVGASDRRESVGGSVLANLRSAGFGGSVYAVNSRRRVVQGQTAYASIRELPSVPQLAVLCTSAATIPDLVAECGRAGIEGVIVMSAGFREAGSEGRALEAELEARLKEFPDLRMIGPNCLGILRPSVGLNASFSPVMPKPGRLTLLTQSGALGTAIMDWSLERDIGFASCVSVGNMVDIGMAELIDHFADDDETEALLLYIEGLPDGRKFLSAARACSGRKPVIAYKAGRFEASSRAAASHTGAMASSDAVYDAAFRRAGVERVQSIEELFDCARLLAGRRRAVGDRLAIITNAGGPGIMACDAWLARGNRLAVLGSQTRDSLDRALPTCWSHGNPIDVLGDASVDRYRVAVEIVLADPAVDLLLTIVTPQSMTEADRFAEAVVSAQQRSSKTIVACWMGGQRVQAGRDALQRGHVPVYDFPEGAVQALHHLVSSERLHESRRDAATSWDAGISKPLTPARIDWWRALLIAHPGLVNEVLSKSFLAESGIPIVPTQVAQSADEAVAIAESRGYPVVLKILSPDISHKTDVGGVQLNLANAEQVLAAYRKIQDSVRERAPAARREGVAVQPMVASARGVELLLGMQRDRQFGPVILLGAGGVTAELQRDSVLELAPLDQGVWERMLHSLRLFPLLEGYRGRPGVNLAALEETVRRFTQLAIQFPELESAEINPLLATAETVIALDARLIAGFQPVGSGAAERP